MALVCVASMLASQNFAFAQQGVADTAQPTASNPTVRQPNWPRVYPMGAETVRLYPPQVLRWDDQRVRGRAAFVIVGTTGTPTYGWLYFEGRARMSWNAQSVRLHVGRVGRIEIPMAPGRGHDVRDAVGPQIRGLDLEMPLASVEKPQTNVPPVDNTPPAIVFTDRLSVLVPISGTPVLRPVAGAAGYQRVVNTSAMVLVDPTGAYVVEAGGSWFTAATVAGPWVLMPSVPPALSAAATQANAAQKADPLLPANGQPINPPPAIIVATVPTELVQTDGAMKLAPVGGTDLQTIENADHAVFLDPTSNTYYVLISGRWFASQSLSGGWQFVASNALPPSFAQISPTDPRASVLVSVAGTPQARAAAIAATIPQTSTVSVTATATATYEGAPAFAPIPGTQLSYATNSPEPVIQVAPQSNYMVSNGVWFTAPAPTGPWTVATAVPPEIYAIPPDSPVHYVTSVRIYATSPGAVTVGYTPGYMGVVVDPAGTVVYGTGYSYPGYVGTRWIAPPATYGYGAGFALGGPAGFGYGFSSGWAWGAAPAPHWGPYVGPGPVAGGWGFANAGGVDLYGRWGGYAAPAPVVGYGGPGVGVGAAVGFAAGVGVGAALGAAAGGFSPYSGHYMAGSIGNHINNGTINNNTTINNVTNNTTNNAAPAQPPAGGGAGGQPQNAPANGGAPNGTPANGNPGNQNGAGPNGQPSKTPGSTPGSNPSNQNGQNGSQPNKSNPQNGGGDKGNRGRHPPDGGQGKGHDHQNPGNGGKGPDGKGPDGKGNDGKGNDGKGGQGEGGKGGGANGGPQPTNTFPGGKGADGGSKPHLMNTFPGDKGQGDKGQGEKGQGGKGEGEGGQGTGGGAKPQPMNTFPGGNDNRSANKPALENTTTENRPAADRPRDKQTDAMQRDDQRRDQARPDDRKPDDRRPQDDKPGDHRPDDHRQQDQRQDDHRQDDHRPDDHRNDDHARRADDAHADHDQHHDDHAHAKRRKPEDDKH
ncbi:carbohydrate-binding family V/XII [Segnochrobactrum spirostomi]|uniref:carbohydrate-binding family V/XII n=1 Tax=Segnochrobactrum spirostomi TaxID=2608987 RepID=UPI001295A6AB|nr:carbohydrate-binding family V/XII [Segnochrobactrum spirostomi]